MKKTKKLKKNYEFKEILSNGKYYSGRFIEAFIKKANNEEKNFLGIAISHKLCKAVKRNKLKRLIKESYYFYEDKTRSGYCIIFLWKKKIKIENATFENIKNDMEKILKKAEIIEESV